MVAHVIHSFDYGKLVHGKFKRKPDNDINCDLNLLAWAEIAASEESDDWRRSIREARPDAKSPSDSQVHLNCYVSSSNKVVDDPDHFFYASVAATFPEMLTSFCHFGASC